MVAKMRLHEITEDKLNEFAPLAGLAGLARIVGPAVLRGAGGAALRGIAGLGIRGAGMLSSLLSSEPKAQVAYNNMQGADTEEEQKRWAEEIDRQFKEFYEKNTDPIYSEFEEGNSPQNQYSYVDTGGNKVDKYGWRPITADGVYFNKDHANKTTSIKSRKTGKVYTGKTSGLGTQITVNALQRQMRKNENTPSGWSVGEGKSPHPTGSKKYKAHMAAMHASMNERKLTNKEEGNVEHNVKKLKPHKKNFTDQYGKDGESVMYAVATRDAKKGKSYS